ncbi:metabotropic glutamate receptor 7-like [Anneissia japonica]|uniref:metabotropic glutamate receptor 7-like n=1 Tax=Anneissia japonica TaxID=1529436 RepID=UPI001425545C|nr:metabotropic glutamate receptor 7-like [Anneissia japonica]
MLIKMTPTMSIIIVLMLHLVHFTKSSSDKYFVDGDLILGGLMPVHDYNETSSKCEGILASPFIKRVEAFVYAIDKINNDSAILPGINLGFDIRDTCYYDAVALGESVNFVLDQEHANERTTCSHGCKIEQTPSPSCKSIRNITGVVGAQRSGSSIQAATTFGLYQVPQISYLSTSDELSNKIKYKYFLRTVPPDRFQVSAMIDLVLHFNWTYVSILYSDDSYGRNGYREFQQQSADRICLAVEEAISASSDFNHIVKMLLGRGAVTVVLFLNVEIANAIYDAVERLNATGVFVWVASDAVGNAGINGIAQHEAAAEGTFTMVPYSKRLPEFDIKFLRTTPSTTLNPWFAEYYDRRVNCELNCDEEWPEDDYNSHDTLVMDSVYAFAYALHNIQGSLCHKDRPPPTGDCVRLLQEVSGDSLLEELRNTSFDSLVNGRLEFDSDGDIYGRYRMSYFQRDVMGNLRAYPIGIWTTGGFSNLDEENIAWSVKSSINGSVPRSQCSEPCKPGFKEVLIYERVQCCWKCEECTGSTIVDQTGYECIECIDTWPDSTHMNCLELDNVYVSWGSHLGSLIIVTASIGLAAIFVIFVFFIYYRNEQILQNSEPLLNYVILIGVSVVLTSTITLAVEPNEAVCYAARLLPGVGVCMMYSSMALKSIRLQKIFKVAFASDSTQNPKLIQRSKQLGLLFITVSIQIALSLIWLFLRPPAVLSIRKVEGDTARMEYSCNLERNEVITCLTYNFIFITICCASVFKARDLPDNYFESRFLSFCSFTTIVIILTFAAPYFVTDEKELFTKCIYLTCGLILNSWIVLICMFLIKIYAIRYVKPEEETPNARFRSSTTLSTRTLVTSMQMQKRTWSTNSEGSTM